MIRSLTVLLCLCLIPALSPGQSALPSDRGAPLGILWTNSPIFDETPLEVKLGTFSHAPNPDALAVVLWNDGSNNRLDAVRIPPPYDGTGVTSDPLENVATLFALGDICTTEDDFIVVPYIKDFDVNFARFDGMNWSTSTVPGTTTNNFDSADCARTSDGLFIAGHDLTDSETELYRSTDNGLSFNFYGRYGSVAGAFDGAPRESITTTSGGASLMALNQTPAGMLRATHVDTGTTPPTIVHRDVQQFSPPPGSFQNVRESAARAAGGRVRFTVNLDAEAIAIEAEEDPFTIASIVFLGAIIDAGSQFGFQGGAIAFFGTDFRAATEILWDRYYSLNFLAPPADTDEDFPLTGIGGPVDTCRVDFPNGQASLFVAGPRVGSTGTDLYMGHMPRASIFEDGFESGDVAWWSQCD